MRRVQQPEVVVALADGRREGRREGAVEIRGNVELTRGDAIASAETFARDAWRRSLDGWATSVVERTSPFWLPTFVRDRSADRWLDRYAGKPRLVGRDVIQREHGFGPSFQAVLELDLSPSAVLGHRETRSLQRAVAATGRRFLGVCGATVLFWAICASAFGWLDRLSRGYMTGRLRFLFAGLGLILPTLALFAV